MPRKIKDFAKVEARRPDGATYLLTLEQGVNGTVYIRKREVK